ncbi:saccharopine dehydrogenase NADP-binding domain-containing protein [Acinetobacter seifertii]|uniref:Saccharopine dehydrogenase NADP-binding domain-containing protein n=1 Tax=Acinetobacter seifertii TaxID=1530123 RepID=A0A7H2UG45_9GAMM|nr:saccharopine dehydrogenase NADP-binding domain-containing protein [Acinetobacter seifertii]QNX13527.1 saccharopine dehydrogenase NADP-binding domain-containing protein [Acinetobacter seifertii]QNX18518.1 saccharopine dehydrogenase NADP-binding domain-containing protein [Acinetobacter seifertii]QNX25190.1 saccharopine dehydrogenase NADP-binding domain-containing protein [Acinetobacter seifertii]QNX36153.1 saccharopine dehydrogenase NADP-binding domain-containing protein [Acinetobacter seifert
MTTNIPTSKCKTWLLYGANGYTGELIARHALKLGLKPILAGRSAEKLLPIATELKLPVRIFDLNHPSDLVNQLDDVDLVLNCAGPFSLTSKALVEACISSKTHYLDITGEIDTFDYVLAQQQRAIDAGIVLCSGVGFDVVPTDCIANTLKQALPDATHLEVGFSTPLIFSKGTLKTVIEGLPLGGKIRKHGQLVTVPQGWGAKRINFGQGKQWATILPLGDVVTAFHSTQIPNIRYYAATHPAMLTTMKISRLFHIFWQQPSIIRGLQKLVDTTITGPSQQQRESQTVYLWGQVFNAAGQSKIATAQLSSIYKTTVHAALAITQHLLKHSISSGCYTPAQLMGTDFISTLPECSPITISSPA